MESINNTDLQFKHKDIDQVKWAKLIEEWENSKESQVNFCKRLNLNINTFTYIKGKLFKKAKATRFIPITICKDIPPGPAVNMILENSKGMKLHFPIAGTEDSILRILKIAGW